MAVYLPVGQRDILCQKPIPGLDLQSRGVDVTQLNLIPVAEEGCRSAALSLTCNGKKKITMDGVEYDIPDQVLIIQEFPLPHDVRAETQVFKQPLEARNFLALTAGVDQKTARYAFSSSSTYIKMERALYGQKTKVELVTSGIVMRVVLLVPKERLGLSDLAQHVVRHLPDHYLENPGPYEQFIRSFGTHYFTQATFGGLLMLYAETGIGYFEIFGGDPAIAREHGVFEWMGTISARPWLFSSRLAPISELFTDDKKKHQMEMAVNDHILQTYLSEELRGILRLLPNEAEKGEEVKKLVDEIEDMMKIRPLVEADVKTLGEKVEKAYVDVFLNFYAPKDNLTKANNYDQQLDFMCPAGKSITRIQSHQDNAKEDREWMFGCSYLPNLGLLRGCDWTEDYVNQFKARVDFTCPSHGVLKGWHSIHDNTTDDRRHKFFCCQVDGAESQDCSLTTDFVNDLDAPLHFKLSNVTQEVLSGVYSEYDDMKRDRRWKFEVCKQLHFLTPGKAG